MADFDINELIKNIIGGNGSALSGIAGAVSGYNGANNYEQLGREAADRADPFGSRDFYRDRLRTSYDDPSAILNDPGHQISVQRGLGQVQATNAAKGYLGSGRMLQELSKYASDSDATYLDAERKQLGNLAGAQFDPANAARAIMEGGTLAQKSRQGALDALVTGLKHNGGLGGSGGSVSVPDSVLKTLNGLSSPADIAKQIASFASMSGGTVKDIWNYLMNNPNASESTKAILADIGKNPDGYGFGDPTGATPTSQWNVTSGGYMDKAGPEYNQYLRPEEFNTIPTVDWSNASNIDWSTVDYSQFNTSDWGQFEKLLGISGE